VGRDTNLVLPLPSRRVGRGKSRNLPRCEATRGEYVEEIEVY